MRFKGIHALVPALSRTLYHFFQSTQVDWLLFFRLLPGTWFSQRTIGGGGGGNHPNVYIETSTNVDLEGTKGRGGGKRLSQLRGFQSESKRNENRKPFMDGFTKLAFLLKKKHLSQPINHHSK